MYIYIYVCVCVCVCVCVRVRIWVRMKNENYFTIQLIFATIYGPHYTFWNYSPQVKYQAFSLLQEAPLEIFYALQTTFS